MIRLYHKTMRSLHRGGARAYEALAHVGGMIVSPVERAFAATFGKAFHMLEGFERVEDWLLGLFWLVTWPLRMVWRLIAGLGRLIVPAAVRDAVGNRLVGLERLLHEAGAAAWRLVEWLNLDGLVRWLVWGLQPVWRPIAALLGFGWAWFATRPYKQMLWGLPVLVLLAPIGGAVAWGLTWGRESVETHYKLAAKEAREAEDIEQMQFFERKLAQLKVETQGTDYKAALALEEDGKLEEAYLRMQLLAPETGIGYWPAHEWIVTRLLNGKLELTDEERLRVVGVHLAQLEKLGAAGDGMNLLRANWLARSGQVAEASELLEPLISSIPLAAIQRMDIDLSLERLEDARTDARQVRTHMMEARQRADPIDSGEYQAWARAEQLVGNRADLFRVLREWLAIDPDHPQARQGVLEVDQLEFQEILQSPLPDAGELAERLVEMFELAENFTPLEADVNRLYEQRRDVPSLATMFEHIVALDDAPTPLVAAVGTAAAMERDVPLARTLLQRVVAADADHAAAWNNLAWALSQDPDQDLEGALVAVTRALELAPDEFRFRETRGQILVGLGRWQEAVDDLEFALNGMPDFRPIHVGLATAYDNLGQTELAEIHRQQAQ
jgi:tetratricopeptide (TPR) repeat protein